MQLDRAFYSSRRRILHRLVVSAHTRPRSSTHCLGTCRLSPISMPRPLGCLHPAVASAACALYTALSSSPRAIRLVSGVQAQSMFVTIRSSRSSRSLCPYGKASPQGSPAGSYLCPLCPPLCG